MTGVARGQVCDEVTRVCVGCTQDSECLNGQVCNTTSHTCETPDILAEANGIVCSTRPGSPADSRLAIAFLGLLGLALARRRRGQKRHFTTHSTAT